MLSRIGTTLTPSLFSVVEATLAIILLKKCDLRLLQSTVVGVVLLHLLLVPVRTLLVSWLVDTYSLLTSLIDIVGCSLHHWRKRCPPSTSRPTYHRAEQVCQYISISTTPKRALLTSWANFTPITAPYTRVGHLCHITRSFSQPADRTTTLSVS